MIPDAIAAFVGCFAAMLALAEITSSNKLIRYLGAFVVGVVVTVVLAWFLGWLVGIFARVG